MRTGLSMRFLRASATTALRARRSRAQSNTEPTVSRSPMRIGIRAVRPSSSVASTSPSSPTPETVCSAVVRRRYSASLKVRMSLIPSAKSISAPLALQGRARVALHTDAQLAHRGGDRRDLRPRGRSAPAPPASSAGMQERPGVVGERHREGDAVGVLGVGVDLLAHVEEDRRCKGRGVAASEAELLGLVVDLPRLEAVLVEGRACARRRRISWRSRTSRPDCLGGRVEHLGMLGPVEPERG